MKLKQIKMKLISFTLVLTLLFMVIVPMMAPNVNAEENSVLLESNELTENIDTIIEFSTSSIIILPVGSTSEDLQEAINNASSYDIIRISSDMNFLDAVTVPEGKTITIYSNGNDKWALSQSKASTRHFLVYGNLTLTRTIIDGNALGGGIHIYENGVLNIGSTTIQNNTADLRRRYLYR